MFSRSGSSSPPACTKTGPTAIPSDAATPTILPLTSASTRHPSSLVLVLAYQLDQGIHGLFRILSLGPDHYLIAFFCRQRHDLHRALGVCLLVALDDYYL